ncbi:MAG: hypothetical protein AB1432_03445 [Bacteroidota bacterium]
MKLKQFHYFIFIFYSIPTSIFFSLETKEKTFDEFNSAASNATVKAEPVAGAEIMIELLPGPKGPCITRDDGVFGINFSNIIEVQGKESKVINVRLTIKPKSNFPYKTLNNIFPLTLSKSDGPYYEFILKFVKDNPNAGTGKFIIEKNQQVKASPQGAKQGKGSAVKTGQSYQGEVRHF